MSISKLVFRDLRANELEVRIGEKRKDGKVSLLIYKDARADANILDETLGQFGWASDYKALPMSDSVNAETHQVLKNNSVYCGIAIQSPEGTWIWKWDAGGASNLEVEKGTASDAFKRAAFKWGLGRKLYTAPKIVVTPDSDWTKYRVSSIAYDEARITDLEIVDNFGKVVFSYVNGQEQKVADTTRVADKAELLRTICGELKQEEPDKKETLLAFYNYFVKIVPQWRALTEAIVRKKWEDWKARE